MGPKLLRAYLDKHGELQSAFAERASVNNGSLSGYLAGTKCPDTTSACRIEDATGGAVPVRSWERIRAHRVPRRKTAPKAAG